MTDPEFEAEALAECVARELFDPGALELLAECDDQAARARVIAAATRFLLTLRDAAAPSPISH